MTHTGSRASEHRSRASTLAAAVITSVRAALAAGLRYARTEWRYAHGVRFHAGDVVLPRIPAYQRTGTPR